MRFPIQLSVWSTVAILVVGSAPCAQSAGGTNKIEGRITNLEEEIQALRRRVDQAERLAGRLLAYGIVDEPEIMKFIKPALASAPRRIAIEKIAVNHTMPGTFEFSIEPRLTKRPVILITNLGNWGDVPVKYVAVQVSDVSEKGFKVSISDQLKHINCAFSFFIFAGDNLD